MKKFILATGIAIVGVALSGFVAFMAYIAYLDKCLEDDEANDSGNDSKSDNKGFDKDLNCHKHASYGEFDPSDYPPYENNENPAPDENSSKSRLEQMIPWLHENVDE